MVKIRYQDPNNSSNFIYEELDPKKIDCDAYIRDLHYNKLCDSTNNCSGEDCKIWIEIEGAYILAGIVD